MLGFSTPQTKITQVQILDQDFKVVKKITDEAQLALFAKYWESKKKLQPNQESSGQYKIDVVEESKKDRRIRRYLYNEKKGTLSLLTKTLTPEYQIENRDIFNELIGLKKTEK